MGCTNLFPFRFEPLQSGSHCIRNTTYNVPKWNNRDLNLIDHCSIAVLDCYVSCSTSDLLVHHQELLNLGAYCVQLCSNSISECVHHYTTDCEADRCGEETSNPCIYYADNELTHLQLLQLPLLLLPL
ncbi:MAG: hypothetical protein EZS28_047060 [Streblomastix strix]|uniref:Uncharacterized protein n=1 Tax=Streblomastix strix TaxID=222440 RepID=A0A5J4THR1_9EUKA|nr:MAG: hypothetical protein EZS28_047060 [Streblomastix strix]